MICIFHMDKTALAVFIKGEVCLASRLIHQFVSCPSYDQRRSRISGRIFELFGMVVMIPVGLPIAVSASEPPMSSGFAPGCYAVSVLMVLLAGTLVAFGVAVVLTKQLNKKTIVERLREAE